jgi:hypothetical protein
MSSTDRALQGENGTADVFAVDLFGLRVWLSQQLQLKLRKRAGTPPITAMYIHNEGAKCRAIQ